MSFTELNCVEYFIIHQISRVNLSSSGTQDPKRPMDYSGHINTPMDFNGMLLKSQREKG